MKLSPVTFIIMGIAFAVIFLSFAVFHYVLPNAEQTRIYQNYKEQLDTEGAKMGAAKQRVENARVSVEEVSDEWQEVVARRTPPTSVGAGGIDLTVNPYQLTVDARVFRDNVQKAVNAQVKRGGVTVVTGPYVSEPPETPNEVMPAYFNYPTSAYPVSIFDLGTVTVRGTWDQIMANYRSWQSMPNYLAVPDGLSIQGTSPNLTATYNVTVVAFIRGKELSPTVETGAAAAALLGTGAPGGFPGAGGPGRMPGGGPMPPGGPSGPMMGR